ncbi:hypothetical protein [Achromobacter piechaudii]|uniref:Uncharacterized protein n=1 Tax=Achromobacter piechaudii TaxID=72556 RepID=A0ABM8KY09_9BURK|nr:hypothetical protein [Achromobacter piechaudii]CAB3704390.1 hypothetical protein LMG1873_02847 [Achromobacter piechaudii]
MNNVHHTTLAGAVRANRAEFEAAVQDGVREGLISIGIESVRSAFFSAEGMFEMHEAETMKKAA